MNPKAIYFDLGDTLVYTRSSFYWLAALWAVIYLILEEGIFKNPRTLSRSFYQAFREELLARNGDGLDKVKDDRTEYEYWYGFFEQVLIRFGLTHKHPLLIRWLARGYVHPRSYACFPEVHAVLSHLNSLDIELGILSNAFPSAERIMCHLDLMQYFKFIIFSYEIPDIPPKPNRAIYEYALNFPEIRDKIQRPGQVWFVDDRPKFVEGAKKVGLNAFLIDRNNEHPDWQDGRISNLQALISSISEVGQKAPNRIFECCTPAIRNTPRDHMEGIARETWPRHAFGEAACFGVAESSYRRILA